MTSHSLQDQVLLTRYSKDFGNVRLGKSFASSRIFATKLHGVSRTGARRRDHVIMPPSSCPPALKRVAS